MKLLKLVPKGLLQTELSSFIYFQTFFEIPSIHISISVTYSGRNTTVLNKLLTYVTVLLFWTLVTMNVILDRVCHPKYFFCPELQIHRPNPSSALISWLTRMLISKLTNFKKKTKHFQNNILIVTLDFTYITLNDLNIFYCLEKLCVQVMKIIPTNQF